MIIINPFQIHLLYSWQSYILKNLTLDKPVDDDGPVSPDHLGLRLDTTSCSYGTGMPSLASTMRRHYYFTVFPVMLVLGAMTPDPQVGWPGLYINV